jgi:hypothetical protein
MSDKLEVEDLSDGRDVLWLFTRFRAGLGSEYC